MKKRIYFPRTTAQQRELLFRTREATDNVNTACRKAHVCRQTFYNWKERFDAGGYAALEHFASSAPHNPRRTPVEIEQEVIALRREHPSWGKKRIADEVAKRHNWEIQLSRNTVRRILTDAELWKEEVKEKASSFATPVARTADEPNQTFNIDLAFIPATHETAAKLPAVSGSSGRLVVEQVAEEEQPATYPGQVFANSELEYAEAMQAFITASQESSSAALPQPGETASVKEQKRTLRQAEAELRAERRAVRERRRQEDQAWREMRTARSANGSEGEKGRSAAISAELRRQHREQLARREREDAEWRQRRAALREQLSALPVVTAWIAVLVVVDSCTRQCLGLPLFTAGSHVTAEMIVMALESLLPAGLQFLVSDRGVHFRSAVFEALVRQKGIMHVLTARHRPQSNGIAERFVRTLKEWLAEHSWQTLDELTALVTQFLEEYNDRPHQGLPLPGLSPNEFAKRLWVL